MGLSVLRMELSVLRMELSVLRMELSVLRMELSVLRIKPWPSWLSLRRSLARNLPGRLLAKR